MAAEDARMKAGLKTAEDELNLIKNQVQQTLLDIREHILDATNPFNSIDDALTDEDEIEFDDLMGGGSSGGGSSGGGGGGGGADGGGGGGGGDGDGGLEDLVDDADGDGDIVEEIDDGAEDDLGEEIIEEIPDDGYMGDEIIDDGGGGGGMMMPAMSDPAEYFEEEEEIPEEIDEGFEVDEEPEPEPEVEDSETAGVGAGAAAEGADAGALGGAVEGALAPLAADFDVLTMAGLVRWVAVTTSKLGANRTEIMLDAFEAAGRIAPSTRAVLHHLMALTEEEPSAPVPVREIVSAMVRMEGVMDASNSTDSTRLLSMLMDVAEDPLDLIA